MHKVIPLLACLSLLSACGDSNTESKPAAETAGKIVLTTFYPTQYFAERIAGDFLKIDCPVPADADPIFWQPDSASLQRYQSADLIIVNGAEFEKWIGTVSLPENRIVDTAKSFEKDFIEFTDTKAHKHGDGEEHTHTGIDGHTWLDPHNAKIQAAAIRKAFAEKWPENAAAFEENFKALAADLDSLDAELKQLDLKQPLLASHPAYNYLAHRYAWKITNLDLDPEALPPKDAITADHPAKLILWESEPRRMAVSILEKNHGIKSIVFSPAELRGEADYLATMRQNIATLKAATQ